MTEVYGSDAPIPYEWSGADNLEQEQSAETWEPQAVPVKVIDTVSRNLAPDATAFMTWNIPQAPNYVQICPHRYSRYKAKFCVILPAATTLIIGKTPDAITGGSTATIFSITNASVPGTIPDYDGMQPLYAAFTGTGPVTLAVMDEGFKPVQ